MGPNDHSQAPFCDRGARSGGEEPAPELAPFAVYVAATSAGNEAERVAAVVSALRAHGFTITCTWANTIAEVGEANPRDAIELDRRHWATQCLNEIDAADAVLVLVPSLPTTTRGAWTEAGYAYSEKKHLLFAGDTKQSVFCALGLEFATDDAAVAHLVELKGARVDG